MITPRRYVQNGQTQPGLVWLAYRRNSPRDAAPTPQRRCACGAVLARDNRAASCSPCQQRRTG
jgi:hypothetical protein